MSLGPSILILRASPDQRREPLRIIEANQTRSAELLPYEAAPSFGVPSSEMSNARILRGARAC